MKSYVSPVEQALGSELGKSSVEQRIAPLLDDARPATRPFRSTLFVSTVARSESTSPGRP